MADISAKCARTGGRKRVHVDFANIAEVSLRQRTNIRSLAEALKVPRSTLHRRIKEGAIRPHSNALKPYWSKENKRTRLQFCVSTLEPNSLGSQPTFKQMYDRVHIDEKWFYLSREAERFYLLPEEEDPLLTCKSKHFITKVMFLTAVARPRFDANQNRYEKTWKPNRVRMGSTPPQYPPRIICIGMKKHCNPYNFI